MAGPGAGVRVPSAVCRPARHALGSDGDGSVRVAGTMPLSAATWQAGVTDVQHDGRALMTRLATPLARSRACLSRRSGRRAPMIGPPAPVGCQRSRGINSSTRQPRVTFKRHTNYRTRARTLLRLCCRTQWIGRSVAVLEFPVHSFVR